MARRPRRLMRQGRADLPDRAAIDAYVGPSGEVIWDLQTLRMHDGLTPGGIRLARQDEMSAGLAEVALRGSVLAKATEIVAADLPPGKWALTKNTTTGAWRLLVNDAGTIRDLLNAPEF